MTTTTTTTSIDLTAAIRSGILTFEQAEALKGIATTTTTEDKPAPTPKKKSAPKRKVKKSAPKPEVKKSETGRVYYTPEKHDLTDHQVKRLDNAVLKLWEAGYDKAEWRVEGTWAWIYTFSGEEGTGYSPAFKEAVKKAFSGSKWAYSEKRGAVVYKDFIK